MALYRIPQWQEQVVVNGTRYHSVGAGLFAPASDADAAEMVKMGGILDSGSGGTPEWVLDGSGVATGLAKPDGSELTIASMIYGQLGQSTKTLTAAEFAALGGGDYGMVPVTDDGSWPVIKMVAMQVVDGDIPWDTTATFTVQNANSSVADVDLSSSRLYFVELSYAGGSALTTGDNSAISLSADIALDEKGGINAFTISNAGATYSVGDTGSCGGIAYSATAPQYLIDEVDGGTITAMSITAHGDTPVSATDVLTLHKGGEQEGSGTGGEITVTTVLPTDATMICSVFYVKVPFVAA